MPDNEVLLNSYIKNIACYYNANKLLEIINSGSSNISPNLRMLLLNYEEIDKSKSSIVKVKNIHRLSREDHYFLVKKVMCGLFGHLKTSTDNDSFIHFYKKFRKNLSKTLNKMLSDVDLNKVSMPKIKFKLPKISAPKMPKVSAPKMPKISAPKMPKMPIKMSFPKPPSWWKTWTKGQNKSKTESYSNDDNLVTQYNNYLKRILYGLDIDITSNIDERYIVMYDNYLKNVLHNLGINMAPQSTIR